MNQFNSNNRIEEIVKQIEALIKVVSDNDLLDDENVDVYYRNSDRILNGFAIDDAWKALDYKGKLKQILQSYATEREEKIRQEILEMYKKEYTMTNPPTHNALFLETILALFQDKPMKEIERKVKIWSVFTSKCCAAPMIMDASYYNSCSKCQKFSDWTETFEEKNVIVKYLDEEYEKLQNKPNE